MTTGSEAARLDAESRAGMIQTVSDRWINPLAPERHLIDLGDIAHALSNQGRFTGHTREFYSVAEHSIHVARMVSRHLRLAALLHDGSEAYLADIARPVKYARAMILYREAEAVLQDMIFDRFDIVFEGLEPGTLPPEIKAADDALLRYEQFILMPENPSIPLPNPDRWFPRLPCWSPNAARQHFLEFFFNITIGAGNYDPK